jgi:hypothetical protein
MAFRLTAQAAVIFGKEDFTRRQVMIRRLVSLLIGLAMALTAPVTLIAQNPPATEQEQKAQAERQKKALDLLEQVVAEAQGLKLPENRLRVQWQAGDLFWEHDEARARAMFSQAAAGVSEMIQSLDSNDRRYASLLQAPLQLRQEMVNATAQRDPKLAYDLLLATRPPVTASTPTASQQNAESNLELNLLSQIAAADPRLALQNAEAALDKGQFSSSLARLLAQLQEKDKGAASKLKDKMLKRLRPETLLSNAGASSLALSLLRPGPRLANAQASSAEAQANSSQPQPVLDEMAFRELLEAVVAASLSAAPRNSGQPGATVPPVWLNAAPSAPSAARAEQVSAQTLQNNARNLVNGLRSLLPQVDQYLPARSQAVRQKFAEMGIKPNSVVITPELSNLMRQGSTDDLLRAAARASSPDLQSMLYRQATSKAISEGNLERARQIATQSLDPKQREGVMREIERHQTMHNALAGKIEEARQTLATMKTDAERVNWLTQVAGLAVKKNDPKLALQFLDDARTLVSRRVENYQQFEPQLRLARAYAQVDPARGLEILEPGIGQLNELLAAAAALSGFELRVFKDGEMLLQGGGQLTSLVARYGQELARLARGDFERAQAVADRFQRAESRLIARLAMARGILRAQSPDEMPVSFNFGFGEMELNLRLEELSERLTIFDPEGSRLSVIRP